MMPSAYALTKYVAQNFHRLWHGEILRRIQTAPIYYFPDYERFNCDDVETVANTMRREPLRLPHDSIVFEVADGHPEVKSVVVLVTQSNQEIEGYLVISRRVGN